MWGRKKSKKEVDENPHCNEDDKNKFKPFVKGDMTPDDALTAKLAACELLINIFGSGIDMNLLMTSENIKLNRHFWNGLLYTTLPIYDN
jgi:hypothetical protein